MGQGGSIDVTQSLPEFKEYITNKAFESMPLNVNYRHLTMTEKQYIDKTILRFMQTERRIETKILECGMTEPDILDAFYW
ncbi:hypothetical protein TVAG_462780 [Trichomonas vaginalis G3]|uniref:Uncharacterized protein n=1 Tax=Trichomonas vaginalis (strain ATCC PRA-98 / G3) TaxID=412133 RepID=A2DLY9_TRIV3|nr:hypothetical protein TVAGG3_1012660 [Trichomonas vaginalis G3]EAY18592.1 hypothetical protein TVAG_462780 [Trichomonas vaginalis G3]KAI5491620.1 hypothetical protein TVAGG3_1012660 [Trichomonas vaginalis G3]|eukprot:XP_001579578.1 hypothetical protein [Trichomonas vaginalis G3]